jgi:hypothetical protein
MFIWRACDDILPTKQNLLQRAVISNDLCHFCLQETEHMLAFKIMRLKKKKKKNPYLCFETIYFILFYFLRNYSVKRILTLTQIL